MSPVHPRARLAAAALALAVGTAGCGQSSDTTPAPPLAACTSTPSSASRTPTVAFLAATGAAPSPALAATRAETISTVVSGAKRMSADFLLNGVDAGIGAPNLLVNTVLVPQGPNPLFRTTNINCKSTAISTGFRKLATTGARTAPDLVSALSALKDDLKTFTHGPVNVVILSSALDRTALNTADTLDLANAATLADPVKAINSLAGAGLNFDCTGWKVTMIGGSLDPEGKPLSDAQNTQLQAFWRQYFQHCGGTLVAYSTQIAQYPASNAAISSPDYATMPLPIVRRPKLIIATLNSSLAFNTGSAALLPQADTALQQLLPLVAQATGTISVDGYTDNTGTDAINKPLSDTRAAAVAAWITANAHLPAQRLAAEGHGSDDPAVSNATPAGQAKNRRVVVTIHTP